MIIILWIIFFTNPILAKEKVQKKLKPKPVAQIFYGKSALMAEINHIINAYDASGAIGIQVKSMKDGDFLYSKNESRLFVPASIVKIMTAEAALLYLGAEYRFPTTLLTDATNIKPDNGKIQGNLYLVQSGDPTLTFYDLTDMMVTLKSLQIQGIDGNVYIDNTAYDQDNFGPGWIYDDKQYCYSAPINASIINHNCLSFKVAPAAKSGQLASIVRSPRFFYGVIENSIVTKNPGTKGCFVQMDNTSENIAVTGCVIRGHGTLGISTVIEDIADYNKDLFKDLFKRFSIRVNGEIVAGEAVHHLTTIAVHHSDPLHTLIYDMLKKSDNIIAGSLLKKMGEFFTSQPGTWQNGGEAVKQILARKAGVDTRDLRVIDGSGLSPDNRVKPLQMMQVLDFAFHNYANSYEFISGLPIAGRDGTLKNRLHNVYNKVRAKTGTLAQGGVVSLAGFAVSKDKEPLAFVIMVNGHSGNVWKYREMEDKIVTALTNYQRGF
jgi:D-alanyl-D-alanine carboxypeptidase/D-alanyl-D-alanine-endopeptidase (penicillin-binding protein 4)